MSGLHADQDLQAGHGVCLCMTASQLAARGERGARERRDAQHKVTIRLHNEEDSAAGGV